MNNLEGAYILAVDDNPHNLVTIKAILDKLGQTIIFANSAEEALRHVLTYDFAVILLDVEMPHIDGFETARLIRTRARSSYTPIIFLSAAYKDKLDVSKGYEMGAVDYIFKPIDPLILRSKIQVFVDLFTKSTLAIKLQNELKNRLHAEQKTYKQQHQLKLARSEHVKAIEEMSSALAHELNQPLAAIINYVKGCIHRLNQNDLDITQFIYALQRTAQQAERAGSILHRIKDFVGKSQLYLESVDLHELIKSIPDLLPDEAHQAIDIQIKINKKKLPQMLMDKIQMEQVLLNLVRNSIEVLQDYKSQKPCLTLEVLVKSGIIIKVKDNGPGIDAENINKLFDLYFTTKTNGMGVGLSICRSIVEAHGGQITAYNNPEGGACFQIDLPVKR